jgi:hypothetical protein
MKFRLLFSIRFEAAAAVLGTMCSGAIAQEVQIPKAYVPCVVSLAEFLIDSPSDPVEVFLDLCADEETLNTVLSGGTRVDLPTLDTPEIDQAAQIESIMLSKAQLSCLVNRYTDGALDESDPVILREQC